MTIEKRVNLKNNIYFVVIDVEYKLNEYNITQLCIKDYKDDYYDGGDLSILIKKIEEHYDSNKIKKYDNEIRYMADVLYIYDRIPFLSGIKEVYINNDDILPNSICYISKYEMDKYIEEHNVLMVKNDDFKLYNQSTWKL